MTGRRPVSAREARELAHGVRPLVERPHWYPGPKAGPYRELPRRLGLRASATRVLELLLRHVDEQHVVSRRTSWIATQLDLGHSTVERARRELELAGLVHVVRRGVGHVVTVYRVAVEHIRELTGALQKRALTPPEEGTPPLQKRAPSPPEEGTQRGRARDPRVPALTSNPPSPQRGHTGEPVVDEGHPPVSDGAPPTSPRCPHGRTTLQGCRRCGTTPRQAEAAERERAKRERAAREREESEARRRQEAEAAEETRRVDLTDWAQLARAEMGRGRPVAAVNGSTPGGSS